MRADWLVPDGSLLQFSRPDWFLLLLDRLSKEERSMIILIFWRNWRDHNSITHGGGRLSIDASACALRALQRTFFRKQLNIIDDMKRKFPLNIFAGKQKQKVPMEKQTPKLVWQPPEEGQIKINIDGSYVKATRKASIRVIIRDHKGRVLLYSWRYMFQCTSAEEAKLLACKKSLWLAHQWCDSPVNLESDCSSCVAALAKHEINRPIYASLVEDSKTS